MAMVVALPRAVVENVMVVVTLFLAMPLWRARRIFQGPLGIRLSRTTVTGAVAPGVRVTPVVAA